MSQSDKIEFPNGFISKHLYQSWKENEFPNVFNNVLIQVSSLIAIELTKNCSLVFLSYLTPLL